ncbi:MAG: low specificity L-threonine aldolase [Bacteroidales bacterium]|nr:low specificity L-threonine aldolase [Bacteroidales bacterium]
MRSFASDNNSGVHPLVLDALHKANIDHAIGYGDDPWTKQAEALIAEQFCDPDDKNAEASVFLVFNGTGANSVSIQACTTPYGAVICARTAHINVDECGAPAKMAGCALIPIDTADGKLTPELIKPHLVNFGVCHHRQPQAVYISNVSEMGTVYTVEEVKAISTLLHQYGMYLHMDGARLANACVSLGCTMKELTVDAGVDILSFGGTKNGMMMGEAVVSFRKELSKNLHFIRKQSAQLASKQRYLAAQYIPYLQNNLWYDNAKHANDMARKLMDILKTNPDIEFTQKMETNQLFFKAPWPLIKKLQEHYFFYFWNEKEGEMRFVTSWDTTDEDLAGLADIVKP